MDFKKRIENGAKKVTAINPGALTVGNAGRIDVNLLLLLSSALTFAFNILTATFAELMKVAKLIEGGIFNSQHFCMRRYIFSPSDYDLIEWPAKCLYPDYLRKIAEQLSPEDRDISIFLSTKPGMLCLW